NKPRAIKTKYSIPASANVTEPKHAMSTMPSLAAFALQKQNQHRSNACKRENQTAIQQKVFSDPHRQLPILKMDPVPMDQHGPAPTTLYAQTSARTGPTPTHRP
ncbi:MAG: hypothetical protein AAGF50_13080, partial [Pseudomonadota bacterium]